MISFHLYFTVFINFLNERHSGKISALVLDLDTVDHFLWMDWKIVLGSKTMCYGSSHVSRTGAIMFCPKCWKRYKRQISDHCCSSPLPAGDLQSTLCSQNLQHHEGSRPPIPLPIFPHAIWEQFSRMLKSFYHQALTIINTVYFCLLCYQRLLQRDMLFICY